MARNREDEKEETVAEQTNQVINPVIIEREVTLSLINEKLNYIISKLPK